MPASPANHTTSPEVSRALSWAEAQKKQHGSLSIEVLKKARSAILDKLQNAHGRVVAVYAGPKPLKRTGEIDEVLIKAGAEQKDLPELYALIARDAAKLIVVARPSKDKALEMINKQATSSRVRPNDLSNDGDQEVLDAVVHPDRTTVETVYYERWPQLCQLLAAAYVMAAYANRDSPVKLEGAQKLEVLKGTLGDAEIDAHGGAENLCVFECPEIGPVVTRRMGYLEYKAFGYDRIEKSQPVAASDLGASLILHPKTLGDIPIRFPCFTFLIGMKMIEETKVDVEVEEKK